MSDNAMREFISYCFEKILGEYDKVIDPYMYCTHKEWDSTETKATNECVRVLRRLIKEHANG